MAPMNSIKLKRILSSEIASNSSLYCIKDVKFFKKLVKNFYLIKFYEAQIGKWGAIKRMPILQTSYAIIIFSYLNSVYLEVLSMI
ncbi:hypothetical protein HERIO_2545 [Hepatospora eriocheir]|uniref:Uncharacterized protein n=1 Tax=Hepatospora eriocheir TaxID=1081669 RepID=A0A1X0Q6K5_9MICR|nr:hypothetical protein HERIO_2545 [Hepatospora eriocheir]